MCCCKSYYVLYEILDEESDCREYKNYTWPITIPEKIFTLRKTICSFMNAKGGVIMFGVKD